MTQRVENEVFGKAVLPLFTDLWTAYPRVNVGEGSSQYWSVWRITGKHPCATRHASKYPLWASGL